VARRLKICLINPKFEPSYWGFEYALPLYPGNKKSSMIAGALPYLAGLVPEHEVRLLDENVEEIIWQELGDYDIVGVTGMNVQKDRMRQILEKLREMKVFAVVGGAYASVDEGYFDGLCSVLFSGEADETWPEFVRCFAEEKLRHPLQTGASHGYDQGPKVSLRSSQGRSLRFGGAPVLPRLPFPV
jgi:hypothetical protein